jgi:hypothetical protein
VQCLKDVPGESKGVEHESTKPTFSEYKPIRHWYNTRYRFADVNNKRRSFARRKAKIQALAWKKGITCLGLTR